MRRLTMILGVLAALATGGCGDGGDPASSQMIGAAGGQVEIPGVTLVIPAGALAEDQMITVSRVADDGPPGVTPVSPVYRFDPAGLTFLQPAEVRIALDDEQAAAATLYWTALASDQFEVREAAVSGSELRGAIDHFSLGVAGIAIGPDAGVPSSCGDGSLDAGEACDDGNADANDFCKNNCQVNVCGDHVLNSAPGTSEQCDDGNVVSGDGCENNCTATDPTDTDGDGWMDVSDCAPLNPSAHPGATEVCFDCFDHNCNGAVDEGCATAQCNDGVDNDGDTKVDFPADPDCLCPTSNREELLPPTDATL